MTNAACVTVDQRLAYLSAAEGLELGCGADRRESIGQRRFGVCHVSTPMQGEQR